MREENYETYTAGTKCKGILHFSQSNFGKDMENESQSAVIFSSLILAPVKFSGVLR